jgi:hypothetical protein
MYYSPVRHSPARASSAAAVRLACVKHAASVQSEPGSNSSVEDLVALWATNPFDEEQSSSGILLGILTWLLPSTVYF